MRQNNWWDDAVIYQVYPRSFVDSNADGEGDLAGVISRLPYLAALGINAIWLSPFYKSPNRDGGYDISDPRDVDPRFGSLADAKELIAKAHEKNIKVIFDIVPNHFSSDHPWFQAALNSSPGSKERARFHFLDGKGEAGEVPPTNWNSLFGGPAWSKVESNNGVKAQWYLHLFDSSQPDLNWENEEVFADFEKTLRFWLDLGVDGFRVDVAHGLVKDKFVDHRNPAKLTAALRVDSTDITREERVEYLSDMPFFDREGVHEIYHRWRKILDSYQPKKMAVAECFVYPESRLARYVRPDELNQVFNFDFLLVDWEKSAIKSAITKSIEILQDVSAKPTWALDNHDSPRVVSRLNSLAKAKSLFLIEAALPGSIYIYQGEELGLPDGKLESSERQDPVFIRTEGKDLGRDGARVPIPWESNQINYGFSEGEPWLPLRAEYQSLSVDLQEKDPASTLNFYREVLKYRSQLLTDLAESEIAFPELGDEIFCFIRGNLLVIANTGESEVAVELPNEYQILISSQRNIEISMDKITMPANSCAWLKEIK